MNLTLPDEPALASFNEAESRTVAASIAGQDQFAFDKELFQRRIPSFTHEMLEEDLSNLPSRRTA